MRTSCSRRKLLNDAENLTKMASILLNTVGLSVNFSPKVIPNIS